MIKFEFLRNLLLALAVACPTGAVAYVAITDSTDTETVGEPPAEALAFVEDATTSSAPPSSSAEPTTTTVSPATKPYDGQFAARQPGPSALEESTSATSITTSTTSTTSTTTTSTTTTTTSTTTTAAPTTVAPTTTKPPATTAAPTTTKPPATTAAPTTTKPPATTAAPTTTKPPATTEAPGNNAQQQAAAVSLAQLNATRANVGLPPLTLDPAMSSFATDWSTEMISSGFRHSSGPYGENIAWHSNGNMTPQQAAQHFNTAWVNSPGHYANMTNDRYTHVGIGLVPHASGWWATHVFR